MIARSLRRARTKLCFGLVYENPKENVGPVSMYHLICEDSTPSILDRTRLADKRANCLLYLHAVNWFYKALRSDKILLFPKENKIDLENPLVNGYEYARPDRDRETNTDVASYPWWELYALPKYQGGRTRGHYRRPFDIYSLPIILLEITYWKSGIECSHSRVFPQGQNCKSSLQHLWLILRIQSASRRGDEMV